MILGYGVAGKAALAALLERDPLAKVLVVDARADADQSRPPSLRTGASEGSLGGGGSFASAWRPKRAGPAAGAGVEFASGARATALNADLGLVTLSLPPADAGAVSSGDNGRSGGSDGTAQTADASREEAAGTSTPAHPPPPPPTPTPRMEEVVGFGRCLLALGSRPRPPPPGFIDPEARSSVSLLGARDGDGGASREELRRDIVAGRSVTIVGSSWQALELACWLQQEGRNASTVADRVRRGVAGYIDEAKGLAGVVGAPTFRLDSKKRAVSGCFRRYTMWCTLRRGRGTKAGWDLGGRYGSLLW